MGEMKACVFCKIFAGDAPATTIIEDSHYAAIMDIYPWRPGHVLVIPKVHVQRIDEMTKEARSDIFETANDIANALRKSSIPCDDVHFFINDGKVANQTVPHVHLHVLPRRKHDLPSLIASVAKRPFVPLLKPVPYKKLDAQAEEIRSYL